MRWQQALESGVRATKTAEDPHNAWYHLATLHARQNDFAPTEACLRQAIASSPIFAEHGIKIAAVFDTDGDKVGRPVGQVTVSPYDSLAQSVRDKNMLIGVMAVPASAAQPVANDLIEAGVKIIFNYSEALLDVPPDVQLHTSNPAVELLTALYFHLM